MQLLRCSNVCVCDFDFAKEDNRRERNCFTSRIRNKLIDNLAKEAPKVQAKSLETKSTEKKVVYFKLPYINPNGKQMLNKFKKKIRKFLNPETYILFKTFFKTTLLSTFTPTKNKTPTLSKSHMLFMK